MLGKLTADEIDQVLLRHQLGRLGLAGNGQVYVYPLAYGYDGTYLYFQSQPGLKVDLLRENPTVCFEVEDIQSPAHWRTVMLHGVAEELDDERDRDAAFAVITAQGDLTFSLAPFTGAFAAPLVFRIRPTEVTGRFEHDDVLRSAQTAAH